MNKYRIVKETNLDGTFRYIIEKGHRFLFWKYWSRTYLTYSNFHEQFFSSSNLAELETYLDELNNPAIISSGETTIEVIR